ncbi:hypothetical protein [Saccharopolyspora hattusasensis]|uniref:hypothetical protein n=1 Tax=Saccharopolyspora hattusasensis TaxID=1128679 RepID=UPI003D9584E6
MFSSFNPRNARLHLADQEHQRRERARARGLARIRADKVALVVLLVLIVMTSVLAFLWPRSGRECINGWEPACALTTDRVRLVARRRC